jgi:REP element-mobilizing transposase RayT
MTYLITFACYGCHLHCDSSGSVDRNHNIPGSRMVEGAKMRIVAELSRMDQPAYRMENSRRQVVLASFVERCADRQWTLLAAHVRTNHAHVVVEAEARPERVMNDLKSYASRRLNQLGFDDRDRKRWARHGSTRWLWNRDSVLAALRYVVDGQGDPMAVYEGKPLPMVAAQ